MSTFETTAGAAMVRPRRGPLYPRAGAYFLLMMLVAFAAFYPSYFSRLAQNDAVHHFHGMVASAWLALLTTQGLLMRYGRVAMHRRVGKLAYLLAPLFVVSGLLITQQMARGAKPFQAAFGSQLALVDLLATAGFAAFVSLGIRDRRQVQRHARWMACTALLLLPPALARLSGALPFVQSFEAAFNVGSAVTELLIMLLLVDDHRLGQRLPPYRVLLALTVAQHAGFFIVGHLPAWQAFTRALGNLG